MSRSRHHQQVPRLNYTQLQLTNHSRAGLLLSYQEWLILNIFGAGTMRRHRGVGAATGFCLNEVRQVCEITNGP